MKILILFFILMACGADGEDGKDGTDGYQDIYDKTKLVYDNYRRSVYRIAIQCNTSAIAFGTGFKISETEVATNNHVVSIACPSDQTKRLLMSAVYSSLDTLEGYPDSLYGSGNCYPSDISGKTCTTSNSYIASTSHDLAVINISNNSLVGEAVELMTSDESYSLIKTGRWNLSMSFPLGFEDLYVLLGQISANYIGDCHGGSSYGCPGLEYDFASTNDTDHGSSGSPIFDLETGKVIGVTTAGTDGENMNTTWAIEAHKLRD